MFASIDGVPLAVDGGTGWSLVPGVRPFSMVFEMDRASAQNVFEAGGSGPPVMEGGGPTSKLVLRAQGVSKEFGGLTVLTTSPSNNKHTVKVQVVDQREFWTYSYVSRSYNIRRKTLATRETVRKGDLPPEVADVLRVVADDIAYATYSLDKGKAWTARRMAEDVLDDVIGSGFWSDPDDVLSPEGGIGLPQIEGVRINGQGDTAISQMLSELGGGVGIRPEPDGSVSLYAIQGGGEFHEVGLDATLTRDGVGSSALLPLTEEPLMEVQDNRHRRPKAVRVFFERLPEGRVDFTEGADEAEAPLESTTGGDAVVPITAFNVFPMDADGSIPATGGRGVRTLKKGTWVTLADILAFWAANPEGNTLASAKPLTRTRIQKLWLSNALNAYASPVFDKGGVWARRIQILRTHYRQTYRIKRPWLDRFKRIEVYRVALEDPETGQRAHSPVYQDYTAIYAWDPIPNGKAADDSERDLVKTRSSNPANANDGTGIIGVSTDTLRQAPATVSVVDQDQGIVRITFAVDGLGISDGILHCATVPLDKPTSQFGKRKILLGDEALSVEHEVSMILTFAMASPNDNRRFYPLEVDLVEAEALLPLTKTSSQPGTAPVLEVFVSAPRAVARFPWDDSKADAFQRAFATLPEDADSVPELGDPLNLEQLEKIAQSVAAREYARFRDHPEGALTTTFRPDAKIDGTVTAVRHEFSGDEKGGAITRVELAPEPPALDVRAIMPKDVRAVIEGFVEQ